jgi:hypothetical protein
MPEKFKCTCGCEFFTNNIYQLKKTGEVLTSRSDWFACLKCGKVYVAKNNKVSEVKE